MGFNGRFSPNGKPKRDKRVNENVVKIEVFLPRSLYGILKLTSVDRNIPMSRLAVMAIDNELDMDPAFNYPVELPAGDSSQYLTEASKILKYLHLTPEGLAPSILMLNRRDIGVENKGDFLMGLKMLFDEEMVEIYTPVIWGKKAGEDKIRAKDDPERPGLRLKTVEGKNIKGIRRVKDGDLSGE